VQFLLSFVGGDGKGNRERERERTSGRKKGRTA
jgi:hypothetical protein